MYLFVCVFHSLLLQFSITHVHVSILQYFVYTKIKLSLVTSKDFTAQYERMASVTKIKLSLVTSKDYTAQYERMASVIVLAVPSIRSSMWINAVFNSVAFKYRVTSTNCFLTEISVDSSVSRK